MTQLRRRAGKVIPKGKALAGFLRRARGERTQAEIADAAGIDRSLYNRYENGARGMEVEKARAVAKALGVDVDELLALSDEPGEVAELALQIAALERRLQKLEKKVGL